MAYLATTGTHSCAVLSIGGVKCYTKVSETMYENYKNKDEQLTKEQWGKVRCLYAECKSDVNSFYSKILYPIGQPLGSTKRHYPFSMLMDIINKHPRLKGKPIFMVLADFQKVSGKVDMNTLKEHGFKLHSKTHNNIGGICYIFIKNDKPVEILENEKEYL